MKRKLTVLFLVSLLVTGAVFCVKKDSKKKLAGIWMGTLKVSAGMELRVVFSGFG